MTDNVLKFTKKTVDEEQLDLALADNDEELTDFELGFDTGFDEARETFGSMMEMAEEDDSSPEDYKRGFFIGFAVFFEEWIAEYMKLIETTGGETIQ